MWYIIGYFIVGFIISFSMRIADHYQTSTREPELPGPVYIMAFLFWPVAIVIIFVLFGFTGIDALAKGIANKIRKNRG